MTGGTTASGSPGAAAPSAGRRPAPTSLWDPRLRWTSLGSLALVLLAAFEAMAVTTVMPVVAEDLDGARLYSVAFSATLAASVIAMVVSGRWSDRSGPALPLVTATGVFVVGLVVAGTAEQMPVLVLGRFLQGLGSGAITVTLYVLVARAFPTPLHPRVFGLFSAGWVLPSMIGPLLAGVIADVWSWHWVFLGVALLIVPALALLLPVLRSLREIEAERAAESAAATGPSGAQGTPTDDSRPAVLGVPPEGAAVGASAAAELAPDAPAAPAADADADADAAATPDPTPGWNAPSTVLAVLLAVVVALALVGTGSTSELLPSPVAWLLAAGGLAVVALAVRPLLPPRTLLAGRGLPATVLARGTLAAAYFGTEVYLPLMLQREYGLTPGNAGLVLTVGAIAWFLGSMTQARLGGRVASGRLLVAGACFVTAGVAIQITTALADLGVPGALVGWLVGGIGMGLAMPRLSTLVLAYSTPRDQGLNSSALSISDAVGGSAITAVTGLVFASVGSGRTSFAAAFLLCLALAVATVLVARRAGPGSARLPA